MLPCGAMGGSIGELTVRCRRRWSRGGGRRAHLDLELAAHERLHAVELARRHRDEVGVAQRERHVRLRRLPRLHRRRLAVDHPLGRRLREVELEDAVRLLRDRRVGLEAGGDAVEDGGGHGGGYLAAKVHGMWWIDPLIALILSLFVAYNWLGSAHEQLWLLVGKSASPELLNKLTLMAHNHDERIEKVDTIRAYTVGSKFFAEVHIVMRPETLLHVAHDVGEALEKDIELDGLNICFVSSLSKIQDSEPKKRIL